MRTGQKVCEKDHTIMALDMSYDDGWACAGRKLPGGCKRSISGYNQSGGLRRFGCKKCQYDLCDRCYAAHTSHVSAHVDELKTANLLEAQPELCTEANSAFLFHGTSNKGAEAICLGDFLVSKAGTHAGTLYGNGVYLAESCSKSDEYADPGDDGLRVLLLCRVTLGNVLYCAGVNPNAEALVKQCVRGSFHSVLGDREKARGTFREFIVYDDDQVYPEYQLWYRRVYSDS